MRAVEGIGRRELAGRALAHVASLLFLKSSAKVVRHTEWDFLLWKAVEKDGWGAGNMSRPRFP